VKVQVAEGVVRVEGPKGTLEHQLTAGVAVDLADGILRRSVDDRARRVRVTA
jgi:ribosomal protein L6P/L9E